MNSGLLSSVNGPSTTSQLSKQLLSLPALTSPVCTCAEEVYLCQSCGHKAGSTDMQYRSLLAWRARYGSTMGGLGIGACAPAATEGMQCARGPECLAAREVEVEVAAGDESVEGGANQQGGNLATNYSQYLVPHIRSRAPTKNSDADLPHTTSLQDVQAGYFRQEAEGIGGVLRAKTTRRVRVGAPVEEEPEPLEPSPSGGLQASIEEKEGTGKYRSWCGWCERVIRSKEDIRGSSSGL
jgi:hypothetical protein